MKRNKILAAFILFFGMTIATSSVMAYSRMNWNGQYILGKRSNDTMSLGSRTTVYVYNNISRANGTPNSVDADLLLQKQGFWGNWSTVYSMKQTWLGGASWTVTLDSGTYSVWFNSNKINGQTNSLDMSGGVN